MIKELDKNIYTLEFGKDFQTLAPNIEYIKEKLDNFDFMKI